MAEIEKRFAANAETGGASPFAAQLAGNRASAQQQWANQVEEGPRFVMQPAYVPPPMAMDARPAVQSEIPRVPVIFEIRGSDGATASVPGYMDQDVLARTRSAANRFAG